MSWLLHLIFLVFPCTLAIQSYHFYTHQNQTIPLGRNVVSVDIQQGICRFEPASPSLVLLSTVSVTNPRGSQLSKQDEVFQRIRNLEEQSAKFFAVFDDYILIIRGHNNIVILSRSSLKLMNQYAISELGNATVIMPFKSTNSVVILSAGKMFTCNKSVYSSIEYSGTVHPAVYINQTLFAVKGLNTIEIYEVIANKSISFKKAFNQDDVSKLLKNVSTSGLQFTVCKYRQDTLYCLCRNNGLILIDTNKLMMLSLIKKEKCLDFIPNSNNIYFQCEFYQDFYISSYPDTRIFNFFPSFINEMKTFQQDMLLFQHTSKLTFWYPNKPYKQKQIDLHDHIIQNQIVKNTSSTYILALFKGDINKYEYKVTSPQLTCSSEKPTTMNITFQVEVMDGTRISKEIHLEVMQQEKSISAIVIVILLMLIVVCFLVMIVVICYYEKVERNLRGIYNYVRRKSRQGNAIV